MSEPALPKKLSERTSALVRIAYHQVNLMTELRKPIEPSKPQEAQEHSNEDAAAWVVLSSSALAPINYLCDKYKAVTESNDSLNSLLDNAKNHLTEGIQYITPIPGKIAAAFEPQLKGVGDAFRASQNFFEETVPSITDVKDYFRSALVTTLHWLDTVLEVLRRQLAQLSNSIEGGPKDSTGPKTEPSAKQ